MKWLFTKGSIAFLKLLSLLPFWLLYTFSTVLSFFAESVICYRKRVVTDNIKNSFPHLTDKEHQLIRSRFYLFLTDLLVETLKSFSISKNRLHQKVIFKNNDLLQAFKEKNQSVIVVMGHYGNWELIGLAGCSLPIPFYSLYREQKNEVINTFIKNNRQRFGLQLIAEQKAVRTLPTLLKSTTSSGLVFIADQAVSPDRAHWINFLHQPATFVKGPALYAKKYNCPVLYADVSCPERGTYEIYFKELISSPEDFSEEEITKQFAQKLEETIRANPPFWLWSHRRWKHNQ